MSTSIQTLLNELREDARNNRDLGDRFERLILAFLTKEPYYADLFSDVWMWTEWPDRGNKPDTGIDLVAQERATGDYWAIQCKFFDPESILQKADIDSFFTASGKKPFTHRLIVSTSRSWSKHAQDARDDQHTPVCTLDVNDLINSAIDWSKFSPNRPRQVGLKPKKTLREHQKEAHTHVLQGFKTLDRGKLIMACGTGKTLTALRIAESVSSEGGAVLLLVPSLSLLSQSLREWTAEAERPMHTLAVCSDPNIGKHRKKISDDTAEITLHDLAFPATTSAKQLIFQFKKLRELPRPEGTSSSMTVVFSTYQSIDAVSNAQKEGLPAFDLIICDEAHRTTGVTLTGEDESHFVKVHDADFLRGTKRLYMTATPRIYGDDAKSKAKEAAAEICSMDDTALFGEEFHRLGFGEAVGKSLLSDYKVLVLAVDEKYVSKAFQKQIADQNNELNLDDAVKITGCWNGLAKRFESVVAASTDLQGDVDPMRRAVAFSRSIKDSKAFCEKFGHIVTAYKQSHPDFDGLLEIETNHVDGTFEALRRSSLLDWLKADSPDNTCRILSNAKCLSEGVDVPALDAVLFLNPRNSVIDVVQSVGRVMRRAERKRYGYIILPVGIPADVKPEDALKGNEKYKVVWQVLQALRAHDDRFNATINQLELNRNRPDNIQVIGVSGSAPGDSLSPGDSQPKVREVQGTFAFPQLDEWKDAIYGKIVLKCGDRGYWETWARDIAGIAERHITRIKACLDDPDAACTVAFNEFLAGLQTNLNPAVSREDAIEMLAQHLITRPVFDALFANYVFTEKNPVSQSMQKMLDVLHDHALEKETATLDKFYASVRDRAKGIDNAEGRQRVVIELYDEFFRTAFPRMAERLGIVYTPVEVVDFIIRSVEDILRDEFGSGLAEKDVHIIDPFTGTGTFLVRLLQSGLVPPDKLLHKYKHELHANEIVLLAYYIAAINIEEAFHGLRADNGKDEYVPFDGICLTDTFQLYESNQQQIEGTFPENTARVRRQKSSPIRVVISNPPYSAQQESANDNNQNVKYPTLDEQIRVTYAEKSGARSVRSVYDSYVRAIRWASDRIKNRGVIGFVTNGYFIDAGNMDGLRASLADEFTSINIFNLRGNARTSGALRKMEAGNVFGGGARTPVAITLLTKNPAMTRPCAIRYHDIGDCLTRQDKLDIIKEFRSISGIEQAKKWSKLTPNNDHDWINQRDKSFAQFLPLGLKEPETGERVFGVYSQGLMTARDAWVYNFSDPALRAHIVRLISVFEANRKRYEEVCELGGTNGRPTVDEIIDTDAKQISWSRPLKSDIAKNRPLKFDERASTIAQYRPFTKMRCYFNRRLNETVYQLPRIFPGGHLSNMAICVTGVGNRDQFSAFVTANLPDVHMADKSGTCQCFPLYLYEKQDESNNLQFDMSEIVEGYRRRDAITDGILKTFREAYGPKVSKEDIFYYVYGVLHSPEYRTRFAADLKKMLPRIPLTQRQADFQAFSQAGRDLAHWHLNYETIEPWPVDEFSDRLDLDPEEKYKVQKMVFGRPTAEQKARGEKWDKSKIIYNSHVTLTNIPLEAYDYVVNGKPAIDWIMERYQYTRDKDSGIINDPNDWSREHNQPRYIIDLLKRVVRVSIETMKIVKAFPPLNERRD